MKSSLGGQASTVQPQAAEAGTIPLSGCAMSRTLCLFCGHSWHLCLRQEIWMTKRHLHLQPTFSLVPWWLCYWTHSTDQKEQLCHMALSSSTKDARSATFQCHPACKNVNNKREGTAVSFWRLSRVCNLLWSRVVCAGYCPKAREQKKASASEGRTTPSTGNLSLVYDKRCEGSPGFPLLFCHVFAQLYRGELSQESVLCNGVSVNTGPCHPKWAPMWSCLSWGCLWKWDMDNHQRGILHTQS